MCGPIPKAEEGKTEMTINNYLVNAKEMNALDQRTIEELGIPGIALMEVAGKAVAELSWLHGRLQAGDRVAILAGPGNNGGDGFVAARYLNNLGAKVKVFLLAPGERPAGHAATEMTVWNRMGGETVVCPLASDLTKSDNLQWLTTSKLRIDALLGTGFSAPITGSILHAVTIINNLPHTFTVAVDMPTGVSSDTGQILPEAIQADLTITMGYPKLGLIQFPGAMMAGKIHVVDIGIPSRFAEDLNLQTQMITAKDIAGLFQPRLPWSHKGTFGHVLVIAGSESKPGAAILAARAALRSGAGLVTMASVQPVCSLAIGVMPELMIVSNDFQYGNLDQLDRVMADKSAVVIGPGMGVNRDTITTVRHVCASFDGPVVLDADGINAFSCDTTSMVIGIQQFQDCLEKGLELGPRILTPHPREMARIVGTTTENVQHDRLETARHFARTSGCHLLLKGARSIVALPDGKAFINTTGSPALATAGTGDVLAGMAGSFLAQKMGTEAGLKAAVHIHGLAGEIAAAQHGEFSVTAGDVDRAIPEAIRQVGPVGAPVTAPNLTYDALDDMLVSI